MENILFNNKKIAFRSDLVSKYDSLDPRTELEQEITVDLKNAFEKRGYEVKHNGGVSHAPAGYSDIELYNDLFNINIEVAKRYGAQQDGEFNSIKEHLQKVKETNNQKNCFCIFVTPETSKRMIDSIRDFNRQRTQEGRFDMKILPVNFETLELYLQRLSESDRTLYPLEDLIRVFALHKEFVDDLRIKKLIQQNVFPFDEELLQDIESKEIERDMKTLEELVKDLDKLESYMRENGIATGASAINTLIYLVFIKIFEEKRERSNQQNRLLDVDSFNRYKNNLAQAIREQGRAIHELFDVIKDEGEFIESGMFTENDSLPDSLNDDFIKEHIIPIFIKYSFLGTLVDALGAVYEVLAKRSEKDVRVGQFFTPDNVVRFMVKLADLEQNDHVLDPACGTGRFLIHSMSQLLKSVNEPTESRTIEKQREIKTSQLFGSDIDMRVAKIAKMNMWVHGDGKTNIRGEANGLTLHTIQDSNYDNAFDVILTNPPLGEVNYQTATFTSLGEINTRLARFPILPFKNKTIEKRDEISEKIGIYSAELEELYNLRENETEGSAEYRSLTTKINGKSRTLENNYQKLEQLGRLISSDNCEIEITGTKMKGGALFLPSIWHYLKEDTNKCDLPEWRGGKLITILDEGILNTDEYSEVRKYLKTHFYIKAVISLTRDTFVPISKTSTKTSILYAIKKTDLSALQKEPTFFAHVDKVGVNTQGKETDNHLDNTLNDYLRFKEAVLRSYRGNEFVKQLFLQQMTRED
ncbi:AlwI family type II restriction endonuclease [Neobacillus sp. OS1-33]|uniref:AlwI family type II restriction endonuclease n=1 Tax=Neobacillus sp. OS1-33 TaxID=3070683 RepID=UPI0027E0F7C0|nr:AlwI family type II restriction endonuclease [Neobacillus sp. OS1-33]WML26281.1 AlwI family type II restriction endonuclease [Neobacillus sp. OS1-33]